MKDAASPLRYPAPRAKMPLTPTASEPQDAPPLAVELEGVLTRTDTLHEGLRTWARSCNPGDGTRA